MRKLLPLVAALALLLFAVPFAQARPAGAQSGAARSTHAATAGGGTVTGVVVNGSHDSAPVAGQSVTLQAQGPSKDVATTTTDGQGRFSFANVETGLEAGGVSAVYAVYTRFQGGLYPSHQITFDSGATQQTTLPVYDATASDANLHVTVATALVDKPNQKKGLFTVAEFYTFQNDGSASYVGSLGAANGKPMNLLRFSLPAGATNLRPGAGFFGAQTAQVGTGFGATATVPPGQSEFAFAFDMPYSGARYDFAYKTEYKTDSLLVLVDPSIVANSTDIQSQNIQTFSGQQYLRLERDDIAANTQMTVHFTALPTPGDPLDLDYRQLVIVVSVLTLALLALLALYLSRGDLAFALGLVPAAALKNIAEQERKRRGETARERESERKRLLRALLLLDRKHATGTLDEAAYAEQRATTMASLRALLAADLAAEPAPHGRAGQAPANPEPDAEAGSADAERLSDAAPVDAEEPAELAQPAPAKTAQKATDGKAAPRRELREASRATTRKDAPRATVSGRRR